MSNVSRRRFLCRLSTVAGWVLRSRLLAACTPAPTATPAPAPANTPAATGTPTPSLPPTPTATATPRPGPSIIRFYPDVPSAVVHARHAGAWQGDNLAPEALRRMLEGSISALTGLTDSRAAWAALFRPDERIAIKVNAFQNSLVWTHAALVTALTDCLQDAGIPGEQIVIYDKLSRELKTAGFAVNEDGPGVRCYGSDFRHTAGFSVVGKPVALSNVLLGCDALINVPILKTHRTGTTFALKNHYGTVEEPAALHEPINRAMAELNALPAIRDRTRLVIGDALAICIKAENSWPYWREAIPGDSILVSHDPVAVGTLGLGLFCQALSADREAAEVAQAKAGAMLGAARAPVSRRGRGDPRPPPLRLIERGRRRRSSRPAGGRAACGPGRQHHGR